MQSLLPVVTLLLFSLPVSLSAQEAMDMPAVQANVDSGAEASTQDESLYPILRMSQDKSEMLFLEQEAASVIVGNPNHISVLLDTPKTIIVVPRSAGASHFSVIGKDGSTLMQRHVVVGGPKNDYVRIRRSCDPADRGCQAVSTYFCPDTCHEVTDGSVTQVRR